MRYGLYELRGGGVRGGGGGFCCASYIGVRKYVECVGNNYEIYVIMVHYSIHSMYRCHWGLLLHFAVRRRMPCSRNDSNAQRNSTNCQ